MHLLPAGSSLDGDLLQRSSNGRVHPDVVRHERVPDLDDRWAIGRTGLRYHAVILRSNSPKVGSAMAFGDTTVT